MKLDLLCEYEFNIDSIDIGLQLYILNIKTSIICIKEKEK